MNDLASRLSRLGFCHLRRSEFDLESAQAVASGLGARITGTSLYHFTLEPNSATSVSGTDWDELRRLEHARRVKNAERRKHKTQNT